MTIKQLRRLFRRRFLSQRMREFLETVRPRGRILDVGGTSYAWKLIGYEGPVTILNLSVPDVRDDGYEYVAGDGTSLDFPDGHFDTVFSNSVIEHLSTWEAQRRFAAELRRVGRRLWVQTPAMGFPVEPHYVAPFIHWMPSSWRRRLAGWTPWGLMKRPTRDQVAAMVREIRLLGRREMQHLFPDCVIRHERFMGLAKSHIAVRTTAVPAPVTARPARRSRVGVPVWHDGWGRVWGRASRGRTPALGEARDRGNVPGGGLPPESRPDVARANDAALP